MPRGGKRPNTGGARPGAGRKSRLGKTREDSRVIRVAPGTLVVNLTEYSFDILYDLAAELDRSENPAAGPVVFGIQQAIHRRIEIEGLPLEN